MVRTEFSYVAENLLLRGGYRKTHFQADQTTLQGVSQMGGAFRDAVERLDVPGHGTFNPSFTRNRELLNAPEVCRFQELILQTAIRRNLREDARLDVFLRSVHQDGVRADSLEVLGEKALAQGHVDLLMKQRVPLGSSQRVPIEVKVNRGQPRDLVQLRGYMDELGECKRGVLVAAGFGRSVERQAEPLGIALIQYSLGVDMRKAQTFDEICQGLSLRPWLR